jgi:hypothetical protein
MYIDTVPSYLQTGHGPHWIILDLMGSGRSPDDLIFMLISLLQSGQLPMNSYSAEVGVALVTEPSA